MNFLVKEYDAIEDALQRFVRFNAASPEEREHTEAELLILTVNAVNRER